MIIKYVVWDPSSGSILKTGHCLQEDLGLQAPSGFQISVLQDDEDVRDTTHKMVDGVPVLVAAPIPPLIDFETLQPISATQMIGQLVNQGWITAEEGLAWAASGTIPASLMALITALPPEKQLMAQLRLTKLVDPIRRDDPLIEAFRVANSLSHEQIDAFFIACREL